jgi:hypothetical protein
MCRDNLSGAANSVIVSCRLWSWLWPVRAASDSPALAPKPGSKVFRRRIARWPSRAERHRTQQHRAALAVKFGRCSRTRTCGLRGRSCAALERRHRPVVRPAGAPVQRANPAGGGLSSSFKSTLAILLRKVDSLAPRIIRMLNHDSLQRKVGTSRRLQRPYDAVRRTNRSEMDPRYKFVERQNAPVQSDVEESRRLQNSHLCIWDAKFRMSLSVRRP